MTGSPKNALFTKQYNRQQVLRMLRQSPLSRAELARQTGLTRAAISLIAEELIETGVLRESSHTPAAARGRTPVLLELCPDAFYCLGIHINRQRCRIGICDFAGSLVEETVLYPEGNADETVDRIAQTCEALLKHRSLPREKILGVGVVTPGPVDSQSGEIRNPPGFTAWWDYPICQRLTQKLGLPVHLENEANAIAMHNYMDYTFPGKDNFLLLLLQEDGVGSGVFSGGCLLRSAQGYTGELGHTSIDFRGAPCACGNRGCLENYVTAKALLQQFPAESWETLLLSEKRSDVIDYTAQCIGAALINFLNTVSVETVLVVGDLFPEKEALLAKLAQTVEGRTLSRGQKNVALLPALQCRRASILAACSIALCRYLDIC